MLARQRLADEYRTMHKLLYFLRNHLVTLLLIAVPVSAAHPAIYRWVDGNGVTQFSETRPEPAPPGLEELAQPDEPPPPAHEDDYYSVLNQARRMEEQRRVLEKEKAVREAQRIARQNAALQNQEPDYPPPDRGYYYGTPYYYPNRPGHPSHPIAPPVRPEPRPSSRVLPNR